ncbi:MAG: hypothetical protein WCZ89_06800 [Phycisphaerae bacterium]
MKALLLSCVILLFAGVSAESPNIATPAEDPNQTESASMEIDPKVLIRQLNRRLIALEKQVSILQRENRDNSVKIDSLERRLALIEGQAKKGSTVVQPSRSAPQPPRRRSVSGSQYKK